MSPAKWFLLFVIVACVGLVGVWNSAQPSQGSIATGMMADATVRSARGPARQPKATLITPGKVAPEEAAPEATMAPGTDRMERGAGKTPSGLVPEAGADGKRGQVANPETPEPKVKEPSTQHVQHPGRQELSGGILRLFHKEGGALQEMGPFRDGKRQGYWEYYSAAGAIIAKRNFKDGAAEGLAEEWYDNGTQRFQGSSVGGKLQGQVTYWNESGEVDETRSGTYLDGQRIEDPK